MFDIGFSELILVFVIGLVVLGPQRLPVAVKTVVGWIRALRSLAANVQNELAQELKLQELQDSLRKVEEASKNNLTPELKASMEELKQSAESIRRSYLGEHEKADDEANTIRNHEESAPVVAVHSVSAPEPAPRMSVQQEVVAAATTVEPPEPVVHVSDAASVSATVAVDKEAVTAAGDEPSKLSSRAPASITQSGEQS